MNENRYSTEEFLYSNDTYLATTTIIYFSIDLLIINHLHHVLVELILITAEFIILFIINDSIYLLTFF